MKESIKKKFDSIDKSKIKVESTKEFLGKLEKGLNSKTQENADKAEALLDKFIAQAKAKNADIFVSKKPAPTLTPTAKKKATQVVKSKLDSLMDTIANDPLLKDFNNSRRTKGGGKSDPLIDSERKAIQSGPRVSKQGWKNQYGKSTGGRKYYEYRENRIDRKAPNYGNRPWLEEGGFIHPSDVNADKYVVVEIKADGSRREHNNFGDLETARMFASLKREFLPKGSQLMIEDKNGKNLYRSFKSGGYMANEDKIWEIVYIDKGVQKSILVEGYSDIVETNNWKNKNPTKQFVQIRLYDNKIADGGELTEKDYEMAFAPRYLDGQDFAKISDNINKEYLAKDRKSGVHDKFTKYWYSGGREQAMAKYGDDENQAWEEAYEDFKDDYYKMAKGGKIDESTAMVLSQNKAIAHHTEELKKALAKNKSVEPWVVGKIERASTDISDVTHYLDGKTEYAKGGKIDNQYEGRSDSDIWNSWSKEQKYHFLDDHNDEFPQIERGEKQMLQNVEYNDIKIERVYDSLKRHIKQGEYANGGMMADGSSIYDGMSEKEFLTKYWGANVFIENPSEHFDIKKMSSSNDDKIDKFIEELKREGYSIKKKSYSDFTSVMGVKNKMADGGMFADGGKVRWQDVYVGDNALVIAENKMGMVVKPYGRRFHLKFPDGSEKTYSAEELEFFKDEEYAKGGKLKFDGEDFSFLLGLSDKELSKRLDLIRRQKDVNAKQYFSAKGKGESTTKIEQSGKNLDNQERAIIEARVRKNKMSDGKYVDKRNVHNIVIKNPNKNGANNYLSINSNDFLNGLHEYAKGGKLTDDYKYIKRGDVEHVVYRDSNGKEQLDFKPKNGFWVRKKALVDAGMNETKANFDAKEVANELIALSNKAWDTLSIQSGSEIYSSDSLQENLANEYQKLGVDRVYRKLTLPERKKVSAVLTDENEHSLRNYLALRGYNGEAEFKNYAKMYDESFAKFGYRSNWNPKNVDLKLGSFAKGGEMGFESLSKKVAKNYVGDKVKPKYQKEYGKTYDKAEAKEVGNKVASKVYRQQLDKMEHGGKLPEDMGRYFIKTSKTKVVNMSDLIPLRKRATGIANAEKNMKMAYDGEMDKRKPITIYKSQRKYRILDGNSTYAVAKANGWETIWAEIVKNPNMKNGLKRTDDIFSRAKSIRKEGESWQDALQRAKAMK